MVHALLLQNVCTNHLCIVSKIIKVEFMILNLVYAYTSQVLKSDEDLSMDESDDGVTTLRSDGDGARRKHHRLWTVSEVRKLIDGVSQCGVGRWSQIKRLFFASSDHRTPVDLKVCPLVKCSGS